ncbi:PH domain-containing protein [Streptomyces sp. D2-8]|uniref:PH domain-containing protein n=1 Tax=Streptomyces sp. D2-8 TaxID=2707767 RepID=UPI0020BFBF6D|nr:PH domain-containing protein [Streptomyces sp. D2-8]MCK8434047.1 PH domain-containing protein [Streptomyces sp. D2-8]
MVKSFTAVTQKGNEFYSKVRYFGLGASIAMSGVGVFIATSKGNSGEPLLNRSIVGGLISTAITWLAWVLTVRPRVTLSSDSVKVRNWITETVVPYCYIARVRTNDGLVFELKDGSELRGCVVGNSLIGQFGGYPSAKRIRRAIQPFLGSEESLEGERMQEKFSLSLQVPLIIIMLHALCYGILKYIFHVS